MEEQAPLHIFYCYAREDKAFRDALDHHLIGFKREKLLTTWSDREIGAGEEWEAAIETHLQEAHIILCLVSPDFLASYYAYEREMQQALDRHQQGTAHVIPILVRPAYWENTPLSGLQMLPSDALPVSLWHNADAAWVDVVKGIVPILQEMSSGKFRQRQYAMGSHGRLRWLKTKRDYRQQLLERVRAFWIKGVLEHSLYGKLPITLHLRENSSMVQNPWKVEVQETNIPVQDISPDTRIESIYYSSAQELLILGEPGAGKTTLLLELLRDLLTHAEQDKESQIPVVFNLVSWTKKRQPLGDWFVEELREKYRIPPHISKKWVENDLVLPFLDGLDEVTPQLITECVKAINLYREQENHNMFPMVVCSRTEDYKRQGTYLQLRNAVIIQQLVPQQLDTYLTRAEETGILEALSHDMVLRELVTTPLIFSILFQAYRGKSFEEIQLQGNSDAQRGQLFATYVQRMLQHRAADTRFTLQQTQRWLVWLAQRLACNYQTEFDIEQMQPDWLPDDQAYKTYMWICVGVVSLIGLLVGALWGGWGALVGIVAGGYFGFYMCVSHASTHDTAVQRAVAYPEIVYAEHLTWSWKDLQKSFLLSTETYTHPSPDMRRVTQLGVIMLGIFILGSSLFGGLSLLAYLTIFVEGSFLLSSSLKSTPSFSGSYKEANYYKAFRSACLGVFYGFLHTSLLTVGFLSVFELFQLISKSNIFAFYLINGLFTQINIPHLALVEVLPIILRLLIVMMISMGLGKGIFACIQYYALRIALWYHKCTPRDYRAFLNYATEHMLLHKQGRTYVFFHQLLLEYFLTSGLDHGDMMVGLNSLAYTYRSQKNHDKAISVLQYALASWERIAGQDSFAVVTILNNLATVYSELKQYDQAIPLLQRGLNIREQIYKPNHPDLLNSIRLLVYAYKAEKRFEDAEAVLLRSLTLHEHEYGFCHPDTARARIKLAKCYIEKKDNAKAEDMLDKIRYYLLISVFTAHSLEKAQGKKLMKDVLNNIKTLMHVHNEQELSIDESLFVNARSIYLTERYPRLSLIMNIGDLALLYIEKGNYVDAEILSKNALLVGEYELSPNSSILSHYLDIHASVLQKLDRDSEARELIAKANKIYTFWKG